MAKSGAGSHVKNVAIAAAQIARGNYIGAAWTLRKYIVGAIAFIIIIVAAIMSSTLQLLFGAGDKWNKDDEKTIDDMNIEAIIEAAKEYKEQWAEIYSLALTRKVMHDEKKFDLSGASEALKDKNKMVKFLKEKSIVETVKEHLATKDNTDNGKKESETAPGAPISINSGEDLSIEGQAKAKEGAKEEVKEEVKEEAKAKEDSDDSVLKLYYQNLSLTKDMLGNHIGYNYGFEEIECTNEGSYKLDQGKIIRWYHKNGEYHIETVYDKKYVDAFQMAAYSYIAYKVNGSASSDSTSDYYMYWTGKVWGKDKKDAMVYTNTDTTVPVGRSTSWERTDGGNYVLTSGKEYWTGNGWGNKKNALQYSEEDNEIPVSRIATEWVNENYKLQIRTKEDYGVISEFPVYEASACKFDNTFGENRVNDGQNVGHEGIDIMGQRNYKLIAIEKCEITRIGWNGLGGWRVLMRSMDGKREYYYAHMENYCSKLKAYQKAGAIDNPGIMVNRGELLGYMGSSGSFSSSAPPGSDTGTDPHLHIQLWQSNEELLGKEKMLVNPYAVLKLLEKGAVSRLEVHEKLQKYGLWTD